MCRSRERSTLIFVFIKDYTIKRGTKEETRSVTVYTEILRNYYVKRSLQHLSRLWGFSERL